MSEVARRVDYEDGGFSVWTWCPGCEAMHPFCVSDPSARINRGVTWDWDGDLERPTFSPSLLVHSAVHLCEGLHEVAECSDPGCPERSHALGQRLGDGTFRLRNLPDGAERVRLHVGPHPAPYTDGTAWGSCHSFLRAGEWEFLPDSAHRLAGTRRPMSPLPDWWLEGRR